VRDNALAASGLLNRKIGGPSVFPYQPPGLWEELSRGETFTAQEYHESTGPDLYRRSMYTFWKRTVPPAALTTFDAPDREKCTSRRLITNTPLQALVLLNDPTYVEAARALAQRALLEAPGDAAARVRFLFREATARRVTPAELRVLLDLAQRELDHYKKDPAQAAKLISIGASKAGNVEAAELAAGADRAAAWPPAGTGGLARTQAQQADLGPRHHPERDERRPQAPRDHDRRPRVLVDALVVAVGAVREPQLPARRR